MQAVLHLGDLPKAALDAAAVFHAGYMLEARRLLEGDADSLVLVFPAASHDHQGWRAAVIADLARAAAPRRVNGIVGGDGVATAATLAWLGQAPGITGQLLPLETGAGNSRN